MKKLTALALMGALLSFTHNSFAADGTITFRGKIVDNSCTVQTASKSLTVQLPTVSANLLNGVGKTTGETPFEVTLENCKAANTNTGQTVRLYFFGGTTSAVDLNRKILNNTSNTSAASNVGIQITDSTLTPIPLGKQIGEYAATDKVALATTGVILRYWARYYATGTATAGNVESTVQYNIVYD